MCCLYTFWVINMDSGFLEPPLLCRLFKPSNFDIFGVIDLNLIFRLFFFGIIIASR